MIFNYRCLQFYRCFIYIVSQKMHIILKAIMSKSSSMKLNSLGAEQHKFIMGPIS